MLDDYDQVVRDHRAYVVEASADIIGVLVLMDKEDGIILDNVAILPFRYRRFDISRSQYAAACDYHARSRTRSVR